MNRITSRLVAGGISLVTAVSFAVVATPATASVPTCVRDVSIEPEASVAESGGTLTLHVLSSGCAAAGTVSYLVTPASAQNPSDFILLSGVVKLPAGNMSPRPITAKIIADAVPETAIEDFTVWLHGPSPNIQVLNSVGRGRILDDESPHLVAVVDGEICTADYIDETIDCEPEGYPNFASNEPVTMHWSTADGTAVAGVDFVGVVDQVVTIPAGAHRFTLPVQVLRQPPDTQRWFYVRIFNPSVGTIIDPVAVITIQRS